MGFSIKKSKNVVLIVPPGGYMAERWSKGVLMPALGIGYLAAVLEKNGYKVKIIDAHVEAMSEKRIIDKLREIDPMVVGVTFTTETRFEGFRTIRLAKAANLEAFIVAGGPHVSYAADDSLKNITDLDGVIRGEGEYTLLELVRSLEEDKDLVDVAGLSYRSDGEIFHNPPRLFVGNINEIPFPARHLYPLERYNFVLDVPGKKKLKAANIMTSRGCPFGCNFCVSTVMWGHRCRMRSAENVLEEIEILQKDFGAQSLWIFDDTFTTSRKRTMEICELILKRGLDIPWFCEIRVDTVTKEILALMKKAGCYCVGFGVESGSQRIIDEVIGKRIKIEQVERVRDWCKDLGIISNPFFILSHPTETMKDVRKTMDLMYSWEDKGQVSISILHIYPGTRLEKIANENGILPKDFSWSVDNRREIITLPSAQGNVPIFLDKLTWEQISELLFEWAEYQNYRIWNKIPMAIKNIKSFNDIKRYFIMFFVYIKRRVKRLIEIRDSSLRSE